MQNQTFRLFISSTFSDFTEERKLLQTEVFPEIKEYCKDKKLVFQPIDLRWGVTEEASNDQKTLELCLGEVQTSKLHPYPNFLIMMGDRYGTTILPYLIEEKEFDIICKEIEKDSNKELVKKWYKLDVNQIPASYIIKERKDSKESSDGIDYTNRKNWKPINKQLISILQAAVNKSELNESIKKKYFASATEAEIIEGIFKYMDKTDFQENLLEDNSCSEKIDSSHVYAYIRNIKSLDNKGLKEKLVDDDAENINSVKKEIRKSLNKKNTFEVDVDLEKTSYDEDFNRLAYEYQELSETKINFISKMTEYLKNSIDNFVIELEKDIKNKNPEQIKIQEEKFEQQRFKDDKLKLFVGRKNPLKAIKEYIDGDYNKPFIVYGRSGLGKSALMAKAIDNSIYEKKNVVYKFVGSTANINDSPSLLISILKELEIEEGIRKVPNPKTGEEESEKVEDFYLRVYEHLQKIQDNKVIFIDAIDQLTNEDKFLWLPEELSSNLKIIISALDDETYDDTKYFESLKTKTSNIYPLEVFEDAEELITSKLEKYKRTITDNQMEYILSQEDSNSPLYLTIAVEEIRHWEATKRDEKKKSNQTLASTQKEIIDEYISNLTKLFHHDEKFVKRVFSYLYLADGLSESELLEILNTDKDFISQIAPDTHHKKETDELPIVIWARLHFQIKEFLKLGLKDGHESMKFFHREFNKSVDSENIDMIYQEFISLIHRLVKEKSESFDINRWGRIYVHIIQYYILNYNRSKIIDNKVEPAYEMFILDQVSWGKTLTRYLNEYFYITLDNNQTKKAMILGNLLDCTYTILYSNGWTYYTMGQNFIKLKRMLAQLYREITKYDKVESLLEESLTLIYKFRKYRESLGKERTEYIIKNDIAVNYMAQRKYSKAKDILEKQLRFFEKLYKNESNNLEFDLDSDYALTLKNLGQIAYHNKDIDLSYKHETKAVEIYKQSNAVGNTSDLEYYGMLIDYAITCEELDNKKAETIYYECLKEIEKRYNKKQSIWAPEYYRILDQFGNFKKDFSLIANSLFIIKNLVEENPDRWITKFILSLGYLVINYIEDSKSEKINYITEEVDNTVKLVQKLFDDQSNYYFNNDIYIYCMDLLSDYYKSLDLEDKQILILQIAIPVIKDSSNNIDIVREMYYKSYISILRNIQKLDKIAFNTLDTNMFKDVIEYRKVCLVFLRKAFQFDYRKWADEYTIELINIATNYYNSGQTIDGFIYKEENFDVCLFLVKKSYDEYADKYFKTLDNNRLNYKRYGLYNNLIEYNQKHLDLVIELYQKNTSFKNMCLEAYKDLSESYYLNGLNDNNLKIFEKYYEELVVLLGENKQLKEIRASFIKHKAGFSTTIKELLLLSNYLAHERKSENIQINHILGALAFINLNRKATSIFERIIYLNQLHKRDDGLTIIQIVKEMPFQELDEESMDLLSQLIDIFHEESIGTLR